MRRASLLLAFAAALALWLWRSPRGEPPDASAAGGNQAAEPGYVATGAMLFDTDADGRPQYRLHATRIAQAGPGADIEIAEPQFHYQGDTDWTLTAQSGRLPPATQQIDLSGDVEARMVRPGEVPIQLRSATLRIDLQTRRADTRDAVAMEWGRNHLWAAGLHADMQADSLRLRSPVHGEFARR